MTNDLQELVEGLRGLSNRADQLARSLDRRRVTKHGGSTGHASVEASNRTASVMTPNAAVSIGQLCTACNELKRAVESAIAALRK
jgi:hypothetical protein